VSDATVGAGWSRFSARRWTNLFMAALGVFVLLAGVVGWLVLHSSSRSVERLADVNSPAVVNSQNLSAALLNQETGVRGFQVSRDESFLQPYTDGQAAETAALGRLRALLNADQLPRLEETVRLARVWRQDYAEPLIANLKSVPDARVSREDVDRGKSEFDAVRTSVTALQAQLSAARAEGRDAVRSSERWRDVIFAAILVSLLVIGLFTALWLRITILRPLSRLRESTRKVAGGDYQAQLSIDGPADLVELGQDVESMRNRILSELDNTVAAHQLVEEQATELRRSNAELEQFAYVASHDLQEPLRKVASFCQMLERRYGDQLDDRGRQYIDFAVDGAKRMQVLINDLLTFSRVGRVNDTTEPVDLERAFAKALANLSGRLEDTGGRVEHDPLPTVTGDPTLLSMLFQNLVGNALKFSDPGRTPLVRVSVEEREADWLFAVEDNGIGLDPQFAEKIFVIFQRLHNREQYGGTGIGLAVCKKIVEYHGGRIWLDPEYEGGARFAFTLPLVADEPTDGSADETPVTDEVPTAQGVAAQ
jgi:signal transduction histidine kinase